MEIIFILIQRSSNKTHFHEKGCAPSLILKVCVFGTRRWPIPMHSRFFFLFLFIFFEKSVTDLGVNIFLSGI